MKKYLKDDLLNLFNYQKRILMFTIAELEDIKELLKSETINKLYRLDDIKVKAERSGCENSVFYIENCDLQTIDSVEELVDMISEGWELYRLNQDELGFYIVVG